MKFIHCSDFHLGVSFKASSFKKELLETRRNELVESFFNVITKCKKDKIEVLFIAGDLFEDELITPPLAKKIVDAFISIPNTKVFISCGNHDYFHNKSYYNLMDFSTNVTIFSKGIIEKIEVEELNLCVYGYGWRKKQYQNNPIDFSDISLDKDKINVLLLHCDMANNSEYLPVKKEDVEKVGFDYVALGHIHKPLQIFENAYYPGSPEPLDFSEKGQHGYIIGKISKEDSKLGFAIEALRSFEEISFNISGYASLKELEKEIVNLVGKNINKNLYRLTLTGTRSEFIDIEELSNNLKNKFFYVEIINDTLLDYDLEKIYNENSQNVIGLFIASMNTKQLSNVPNCKEALAFGLEALLQGGDKK